MIKQSIFIFPLACFFASCSGFDNEVAKTDFLKTCQDCKVVEVVSEECQDGSILSCMLVKINYTQVNDSLKSVMCQYIKGDSGWHLVE
ncbi:MAG: hypothetical protein SGJ15_10915 [Bacteroidota bacterium]|nr:hypothetical protein [Bacteroidota bacterium]